MDDPKQWLSPAPDKCDICETPIVDTFIDGKTKDGPWGCLCVSCHVFDGCGLGLGRGQKYQKNDAGKWIKVAG